MLKINPLLEEIEINEKINSILQLEDVPYIFHDARLKESKLLQIHDAEDVIDKSQIGYQVKSKLQQKLYASKFILGLKEGNNYFENLVSGGLGFLLGIIADEGFRSYFHKVAKEVASELQNYSKP